MSTPPDFDSAVAALYSELHQSTTPAAINAAAARRTNTVHDMHTYLHRLGLQLNNTDGISSNSTGSSSSSLPSPSDTAQDTYNNNLPPLIVHITGTKGKGSTLSYCESLFRNAYGLTTGMFTSLIFVLLHIIFKTLAHTSFRSTDSYFHLVLHTVIGFNQYLQNEKLIEHTHKNFFDLWDARLNTQPRETNTFFSASTPTKAQLPGGILPLRPTPFVPEELKQHHLPLLTLPFAIRPQPICPQAR